MSGSDPSVRNRRVSADGDKKPGDTGGSAGPGGGPDDCPGTDFRTAIASPDPAAVDDLEVGEVLEVVTIQEGGVRGVVFEADTGQIVGALATDILRIRSCIDAGYQYEALVLQKAGGSVLVEVRVTGEPLG